MHFVICVFISLIILVSSVLFTEVFPKAFKAVLALCASYTTGLAIMILIRKLAETTKSFAKPAIYPNAWIACAITLVVICGVTVMLNKKKAA